MVGTGLVTFVFKDAKHRLQPQTVALLKAELSRSAFICFTRKVDVNAALGERDL